MEESKSVPGARKVRKSSSGARSNRSSRKSSHSSLASLTDSEIPEASELTGSENSEASKKSIPNGTHSDEDQTLEQNGNKEKDASVPQGSKDKGDEAGKHGPTDKQGDVKSLENVNNKTENVNILNTNKFPGQDVQGLKSLVIKLVDGGKTAENYKDVGTSKKETTLLDVKNESKNVESTEKVEPSEDSEHSDKEKSELKIIIERVKDNRTESSLKKSEDTVDVHSKDKKKDKKSRVDDKQDDEKTDNLKTGEKDSDNGNLPQVKIILKQHDITKTNSNSAKTSDGSTIIGSEIKKKESNTKKQSTESKEKAEGEVKDKDIVIEERCDSFEAETSGVNRVKSDGESSEDDSNVKLNFAGFETPSNEKSTMFFRILDDIRIDDSVMEEMADGEADSESDKREEDLSMENFILEDDKTDYEGDYDCGEDIFAPEVVCVPMSGGIHYQFNRDDILSTTSSTPSLSSIKSSGSVPRKRVRDRSGVKKPPIDLSNPIYLRPFDFGWKRELVFRSVSDTGSSKRNADIYYYTPKGKKVRSTREVVENMTDPELTIDNFTFFKEPIGLNDPEKEIIREAKIRGDRDLNAATPPPAKKMALPKPPKLVEIKSPLATPLVSDVVMQDEQIDNKKSEELSPSKAAAGNFSATPKIVLKALKASAKNKSSAKPVFTPPAKGSGSSKEKRHRGSEDELEMGMLPPLWPTPPEKGTAREISPSTNLTEGFMANGDCFPESSSSSSPIPASCLTPFLHSSYDRVTGSSSKTIEVCSIRCQLAMGLIPTLQCHLCLCLYHPECVGLEEAINRTIHSYVCKNCQEAKKGGGISGTVLNKVTPPVLASPPPLTPISTLGTNSSAGPSSSAAPPKLQRLNDNKLPTTSKSQKIVGGVTTWLPPSSMIQLTSKNTSSSKTSVPAVATVETASSLGSMPAQTLMSMNGKRYVVVPKHNVLSVSPAITTSGLSVADPQLPISTFVSANSPTGDTTVSSSNVSVNMVATTSNASPLSSVPVTSNAAPNNSSNNNSNNNILPLPSKVPGVNPNDPSSRSFVMNSPTTPTNPPGVLLVPCVTTANNTKEGSKYVIINGPSGLPSGNFIIGNIPPQQQLQLPAVPTTQPAVPSNESGGGVKRSNEDNDKLPPAKRPKKEMSPKKESTTSSSTVPTSPKTATATALSPSAAKPPQSTSVTVVNPGSSLHKDFYMMNMSAIYKALLHSFQYLKVQELLRASRVCHLWRDIAHHKSLWQTVRMKNSKVRDWEGFANMLRNSGTKHLDLRKMLLPDKQETCGDMWAEYSRAMERVNLLLRIDMCRCPTSAVENSVKNNKELQILSALAIKNNPLNMASFENCTNLTELRLKSSEKGGMELKNLTALKNLTRMKHLSLLTIKNMPSELTEVFENLLNLESLELSECSHLPESVAVDGISKLTKLQRLRLEKGQEPTCPTIALLNTVSKLSSLVQLELINFDIKPGFDAALANCTNLRTLLIIPTYVTQSATTNHVVMEGVSKLSKTLMHFVWGITLELLRVTDLFIDQWEGQKSPKSSSAASPPSGTLKKGSGDSIPILKPLNEDSSKDGSGTPSQVDILQLPKLHKVLTALLPTTKIKILKVPFSATWRQTVTGPTNTQ